VSDLQSQLLQLQARYTADHPDVIKAKADIAEVRKGWRRSTALSEDASGANNQKASGSSLRRFAQFAVQIISTVS